MKKASKSHINNDIINLREIAAGLTTFSLPGALHRSIAMADGSKYGKPGTNRAPKNSHR